MKIATHDTDQDVLVIAEIGNNHEGDFDLAKTMIDLAAEAGAGAVKFQTIVPEKLVTSSDTKRIQQLGRFQFSYKQFEELAAHATSQNVLFMSTPFDQESAEFLKPLVAAYKIASSDNNFLPLLDTVAATGKPVIMSTGMALESEVDRSVSFLRQRQEELGQQGEIALLHCVSAYPTPVEQANLRAIRFLNDRFPNQTIGYSDHTLGTEAAVLSVGLGARIIEKHFTIDKNHSEFRDHQLSADPAELKALVEQVKQANALLGNYGKAITENEQPVRAAARRSLAARNDLEAGTTLDASNTTWLRPGSGIPLEEADNYLGKALQSAVKQGELILPEHLNA